MPRRQQKAVFASMGRPNKGRLSQKEKKRIIAADSQKCSYYEGNPYKDKGVLYGKDKYKAGDEVFLNNERVTVVDVEGRNSYKVRTRTGKEIAVFESDLKTKADTSPKALPTFKHKGRTYTIDERLNEVRSYEYGKAPIVYRGKEANEFVRKAEDEN